MAQAESGKSFFATKPEIDRLLDKLAAELAGKLDSSHRSMMLIGPSRCGKSLLADRLAQRYGLHVLRTDHLRRKLYKDAHWRDRVRVVKYFYKRLLLMFPHGLLIEGDQFIGRKENFGAWAARNGVAFIGIGYSFDRPQDKLADLIAYQQTGRCWLVESGSTEEVTAFVHKIIDWSRHVKWRCKYLKLPYFDLDSADFEAELERIMGEIAAFYPEGVTNY